MPKKEVHPNIKARMMPHNDEAEQAVLGSVLIDENAPVAIMSKLAIEDFYTTAHKVIFDDIPRNPTGKIEKPKLRQKYCGGSLVAAQNEVNL